MTENRRRRIPLGIVVLIILTVGCGRSASRYLGEGARQVIEIEGMEKFVSISFDKRGETTVKDVTFLAEDGYYYTKEFKDNSPMEGLIRWVPNHEEESFFQSRALSRWLGTATSLRLPEDCKQVLGVDVGFFSESERVKNLTYLSSDGSILSREYREGLVDRHLEGWLEIRSKQ